MMAGLYFLMCSQFSYGISTHHKKNVNRARAGKMHDATKKLNANIVTFRLESADKRVEKYDETMEGLMDHFGLNKELKKLETTDDLAGQGFDAWFDNVMSKPFNKYDVALDLRDTYDNMPDDPGVPSHPEERDKQGRPVLDRVGEIEKARKKDKVNTYALAANPTAALEAAQQYFDEEKTRAEVQEFEDMRKALEKLVKAEMKGDGDSDSSSS
jgi:ATP-dependent exoDNAse (exonuclease V) beta subunit